MQIFGGANAVGMLSPRPTRDSTVCSATTGFAPPASCLAPVRQASPALPVADADPYEFSLLDEPLLLLDLMALVFDGSFHFFDTINILHGLLMAKLLNALGYFLDILRTWLNALTAVIEGLALIFCLIFLNQPLEVPLVKVRWGLFLGR